MKFHQVYIAGAAQNGTTFPVDSDSASNSAADDGSVKSNILNQPQLSLDSAIVQEILLRVALMLKFHVFIHC